MDTSKHKYFALAAEAALKSRLCHRHGAVLVSRHRVITASFNELPYHAEEATLRRCKLPPQCFKCSQV